MVVKAATEALEELVALALLAENADVAEKVAPEASAAKADVEAKHLSGLPR